MTTVCDDSTTTVGHWHRQSGKRTVTNVLCIHAMTNECVSHFNGLVNGNHTKYLKSVYCIYAISQQANNTLVL